MKKWVILIGTIAVFSIGGYLLFSFYAVKWVQPQLRRMLGPGFTVAEILSVGFDTKASIPERSISKAKK